jgi:hypothetical protein
MEDPDHGDIGGICAAARACAVSPGRERRGIRRTDLPAHGLSAGAAAAAGRQGQRGSANRMVFRAASLALRCNRPGGD